MAAESHEGIEASGERVKMKLEDARKAREAEEVQAQLAALETFEQQTLREAAKRLITSTRTTLAGGFSDY